MKKVLFAAVLLTAFQVTNAQVNKGQWLAGGNVSFASEKTGDAKSTTIDISPNAGYFFMNNFAGGLRVTFISEKFKGADEAWTKFMAAPFLRYYFLPAAEKLNIFADGSFGFGSAGGDDKQSLTGFQFMAGPAIFLTPNTALEIALGYRSLKMKDAEDATNTFGINVGFQVHLGGGSK
jgi:hypothetical protein